MAQGIFLSLLGVHKTYNFLLVPVSPISYHLINQRLRKARSDNRDSPIVNSAQLAIDSRGRIIEEEKNDQCLLSTLRRKEKVQRDEKTDETPMSKESVLAKRDKRVEG